MAGSDDLAQAEKLYGEGKSAMDTGDKDEAEKFLGQALDLFNSCIQAQGNSYSVLPPGTDQKIQDIKGTLSTI